MDFWLRLLLRPHDVASDGPDALSPERLGLSLLLDGQFLNYSRRADEMDLPRMAGRLDKRSSGDRALLTALVASLRGDADASARYARLLQTWRRGDGRRALTSVLASIQYAGTGDLAQAIVVLENSLSPSDSWTVMLALHRGIRLAEAGEPDAGLSVTLEAQERLTSTTEVQEESGDLAWIVSDNLFRLRWQARRELLLPIEERLQRPEPIGEIEDRIRSGLVAFFDGNFTTALRSFKSRSVTFQSQDPVTAELDAGRLRAECIADLEYMRRTRQLAGRWHLLNSLGRPDGNPEAGFELLKEAHDKQGLESSLQHAQIVGPLRSLRNVGTVELTRHWTRSDLTMSLLIVRESADVLAPATVDAGVTRLISEWDAVRTLARTDHSEHEVTDALGALARGASQSHQTAIAATLLRTVIAATHPLDLHAIGRALTSIEWPAVGPEVREGWRSLAAEHLGVASDLGNVAFAAAATAAQVDAEAWLTLIWDRYRETRQLLLGALLSDKASDLSEEVVVSLLEDASVLVRSILDSARAGSYGFGSALNAPALLAALFLRTRDRQAWDLLLAFLLDSRVGSHDKEPVIDYLARNVGRLSQEERSALLAGGDALVGFVEPFAGTRAEVEGAVFRLRVAAGAAEDYAAISELAAWCASGDPALRLEAAKSILFVPTPRVGDILAVLLQGLVRDSEASVSSQALYALADRDWTDQENLNAVSRSLLITMMRETDGRRPLGVLEGLRQRLADGGSMSPDLRAATELLAANHMSSRVRRLAGQVLDLEPAATGSSATAHRPSV